MKTFEIGYGSSYPLYYTLKGKDDAKADPNQNFVTGIADITGSYLNTKPIAIGDEIVISKVAHVITEFIEQRPANGQHSHPATYFHVKASYKRVLQA